MFRDRRDAGRRLAEALRHLADRDPVVLALPRGGVPVGHEIARALAAPLDIVLVRKIGAPYQPELALGAVVNGERAELVLNPGIFDPRFLPPGYLEAETRRQLDVIEQRRRLYLGDRPPVAVKGRTVILTDDGIATGATMRAALRAVKRLEPAQIVLAVPVAPAETIAALRAEADAVVCLAQPADFAAIGPYYEDFRQLSDAEVIACLGGGPGAPEQPAAPER